MTTEKAILAGGCFWGMQDLIRKRPGVISTRVGYTGGDVPNATYRNHDGHAEAIEITYDPDQISYRDLLEFFFQVHDPTTLNKQGNDIGTSYRSAIFYLTEDQKQTAEDTIADVEASGLWPGKVVTEVTPAGPFWKQSPSTRTTWSATRPATPATSSGPAGSYRTAPTRIDRTIVTQGRLACLRADQRALHDSLYPAASLAAMDGSLAADSSALISR